MTIPESTAFSCLTHRDRRSDLIKSERRLFPCFLLHFLKVFFVSCLFLFVGMDVADLFSALARRDLPFGQYAWEFCGLALCTALNDATINSLFWIGANYHRPLDLPDTTGLSWREGILRCLESVQPRSRTSPPSSPSALPQTSLSVVVHSSPPQSAALSSPPSAGKSSPPFAAHPSLPLFMAHSSSPPSAAPKSCPPPSAAPRSCLPPPAAPESCLPPSAAMIVFKQIK